MVITIDISDQLTAKKNHPLCCGRGAQGLEQLCEGRIMPFEESRTANDGGREGALGEGESASRRAPCEGGGCTLEEHCPGGEGVDDAGRLGQEREFGGLRLGEFEAALVRPSVIGWLSYPIGTMNYDESALLIGRISEALYGRHQLRAAEYPFRNT